MSKNPLNGGVATARSAIAAPSRKRVVLLINPYQRIKQYASNIGFSRLLGKKSGCSPLALPLLAALTPDRYTVRIIDEELESIAPETAADLVGITAMSCNVDRGYEIADRFRARGIPVIMGGPHVSVCTEEALGHADCVVKGEAENVWAAVLDDFEHRQLKRTYQTAAPAEYRRSPMPRWDLVDTGKLTAMIVQVSRGCPHHCEFCLVSELFGHTMRYREVDDVIAEVANLPLKTIFFADDNLTANKAYARELVRRLKPLGVEWFCMASIEIAEFPDLLRDMADSGCMHILIGFESLNPASLAETGKRQNRAEKYTAAIRKIHDAGITVNASMIVGFDTDTLEEYDRIHRFLDDASFWYVNLNILDVIPGSRLFKRIEAAGRWYGRPPEFSGGMFPAMHYNHVSQLAMFEKNLAMIKRVYSCEDLHDRVIRMFSTGTFARRFDNPDVTAVQKITMTFRLVWAYLVVGDRHQRRLFLDLFALMRRKKVAVEKIVFLLATVEGIRRYLADLEPYLDKWREKIRGFDKGPWLEMKDAAPARPEVLEPGAGEEGTASV